eukprot:11905-Heterococcus_DN1.PRE.1
MPSIQHLQCYLQKAVSCNRNANDARAVTVLQLQKHNCHCCPHCKSAIVTVYCKKQQLAVHTYLFVVCFAKPNFRRHKPRASGLTRHAVVASALQYNNRV